MEHTTTLVETLLERATEYGKSSLELVKLKTLDKSSDVASTIVPQILVYALLMLFMLFLNLGLAFWLGEVFGKIYYGFLVVAGFYCLVAIIFYFFMRKWIKKMVRNYIIKQVLS